MSKARSPRGVDSMTMGTRPDIVASGRGGELEVLGGGKGGHEEEEKEESDRGEEVRGGRRRLEEVDDESDGIVVAFMIDDASAAGKPLRAPAADAAAARRAASSTAPRLIEAIPSFGKDTEVSRREVSEEEDERGRLQSKLFLKNSDLLCVFFFFFFFFFFLSFFLFSFLCLSSFYYNSVFPKTKTYNSPPLYTCTKPQRSYSPACLVGACVFVFFALGGKKNETKLSTQKKKNSFPFSFLPCPHSSSSSGGTASRSPSTPRSASLAVSSPRCVLTALSTNSSLASVEVDRSSAAATGTSRSSALAAAKEKSSRRRWREPPPIAPAPPAEEDGPPAGPATRAEA